MMSKGFNDGSLLNGSPQSQNFAIFLSTPRNIWSTPSGAGENGPGNSGNGSGSSGNGAAGSIGSGFSNDFGRRSSIDFWANPNYNYNLDDARGLASPPFNIRRHSYDGYPLNQNPNQNPNQNQMGGNGQNIHPHQLQQQRMANSPRSSLSLDFDENNFQLVHEYFECDPHERVKVTVQLLQDRFFDEEKYLGDAYQLPKFPVENNSLRNYQLVLVAFKAGRIDVFYLPASSNLTNLNVNDLVIVEADRGRDLGKVVKLNISIDEARLLKLLQFQEQQAALSENTHHDTFGVPSSPNDDLSVKHLQESSNTPSTLNFPKSILALAQPNEVIQILNKKQDEEKACRLCLTKISNTIGLLANAASSPSSQSSNNSATSNPHADLLQMKLIDAEYQFDRKKLIFYYSTNKRIDFRDLVRELFRIYKTRIWMCAVVGLPYVPCQPSQQSQTQPQGHKGNSPINANYFGASEPQPFPSAFPRRVSLQVSGPPYNDMGQGTRQAPQGGMFYNQPAGQDSNFPTYQNKYMTTNMQNLHHQQMQQQQLQQQLQNLQQQFQSDFQTGLKDTLRRSSGASKSSHEDPYLADINEIELGTTGTENGESFVLKSLVDSINY